ncbi:MAG TPA: hypothetical protein VF796_22985 [Humisphaera sp.]
MLDLPILLPALVLLAGAALVAYARRGRVVDDHLLCARCGFDLTGKPPASRRCSECGATLGVRRSIRRGNREPRRRLLLAGAVPAAACGCWLLAAVAAAVLGTRWERHAPLWWLDREARCAGAEDLDPPTLELADRVRDRRLDDGDLRHLLDDTLALQADPGRPWRISRGVVFEAARAAGRVDVARWERYVDNAVVWRAEVPATVGPVDPVPFRLTVVGRGGIRPAAELDLMAVTVHATVDGAPIQVELTGPRQTVSVAAATAAPRLVMTGRLANGRGTALGPGPHAVALGVGCQVSDGRTWQRLYKQLSYTIEVPPAETRRALDDGCRVRCLYVGPVPGGGHRVSVTVASCFGASGGRFSFNHAARLRVGAECYDLGLIDWPAWALFSLEKIVVIQSDAPPKSATVELVPTAAYSSAKQAVPGVITLGPVAVTSIR